MPKRSHDDSGDGRREAFVRHYLIYQNASRAYREAGYQDGPGTRQSARRLLTSAYVQERISEERQNLMAALDVKVEDVVRRLRDIAFSDIAEIVGCHVGACRYCYGTSHAYQWRTPREYRAALSKTDTKPKSDADPEGGYGYCANQPPHPTCPMCEGEGIPHVKFKDTRLLTDSERAVFAGVEKTRSGVRYHFHDRFAALKQLAIRLGFYSPVVDQEPNAIARLIHDLEARGQMQRMQLRRDHERGE
jgi:phage terminase small subunit